MKGMAPRMAVGSVCGLHAFDRQGDALANADAHRCQAELSVGGFQLPQQGQHQSRTAHAQRMSKRDRPAIGIDVPGVVGRLGTVLGEKGINIAGLELGRDKKTGRAVSLFHVDAEVPKDVLDLIRKQPAIVSATQVKLGQ